MSEAELRRRDEGESGGQWSEVARGNAGWHVENRRLQGENGSQMKVVGMPLPMGSSGTAAQGDPPPREVPPLGRPLTPPAHTDDASGVQRTMALFKQAMPFLHGLLPLIDGNIGAAVANLLKPRQNPPPAAPANLAPIENQLAELQFQQTDTRAQVIEQGTTLKRMEDQIEVVREATERNLLEQQDLVEEVRLVRSKMSMLGWLFFLMLAASILLNLVLLLHISRVLP